MAQPASLHPASTNATTQTSSPPPTNYYLARHWCSGTRPRNAMNFVCLKSKIREKIGLGAWKETSTAGRLGMTVWLFLPDQRDQGKDRGGGREHLSSASVQWKQIYATLPYLTTSIPHSPPHQPFSSFFIFFWWHHCIIMILSITPSSSATITLSLEVKSTAFQLGALIFHFLFCLLDFRRFFVCSPQRVCWSPILD